jgi:hypothetical protein
MINKPNNDLARVARLIAKETKRVEKPRSLRQYSLLIKFTAVSGYDEVHPLLSQLLKAGHGVQTEFVRRAVIKACKEAVQKA